VSKSTTANLLRRSGDILKSQNMMNFVRDILCGDCGSQWRPLAVLSMNASSHWQHWLEIAEK
jgi:hypothetical protein